MIAHTEESKRTYRSFRSEIRIDHRTSGTHMLKAVAGWELRRIASRRFNWLAGAFLLVLVLLICWILKEITILGIMTPQEERINVHGRSLWGMVYTIPFVLLLFGIAIPFLSAEGVAGDIKRRTHEVLMAAPLPGWAYVWGRYLAVVTVCMCLALLMLFVLLLVGFASWMLMGDPFPDVVGTTAMWAVAVLPPTLLISGVAFALSTIQPRYSNFVKVLMLLVWFFGSVEGVFATGDAPTSAYWDPTSRAMISILDAPYRRTLFDGIYSTTTRLGSAGGQQIVTPSVSLSQIEQVQKLRERVPKVEQLMLDLWPWIIPHLILGATGLAAVGYASLRFRRFRNLL